MKAEHRDRRARALMPACAERGPVTFLAAMSLVSTLGDETEALSTRHWRQTRT
jgi:hypothetical protein